jgi:hypothetical protein
MILLKSPPFKDFFKNSTVFATITEAMLKELKKGDVEGEEKEEVVDELKCKMVAQLCAETIIKHNMNPMQMGRCDLPMFMDQDNSKEVRKYFELFKKDARKDVNARKLQIQTSWLQNVFCVVMTREIQENKPPMWDELKDEFLKYIEEKSDNTKTPKE